MSSTNAEPAQHVAAIDLGSNSFHMVVARLERGQPKVVDRIRESVRLAAGLDADKRLSAAARQRALACLERFGQRLREFPSSRVRAVGTNTLRKARDSRSFLAAASRALGHEIEVVSGYEEGRLIYLGVAHSLADDDDRRLVVDIGGGSTELIIGERFEARYLESLHMGCVSLTQAFFAGGGITKKRLARAELAACRELDPVQGQFLLLGWQRAVGASGTIRAIEKASRESGWSDFGITHDSLKSLRKALLAAGHIDRVDIKGVSTTRAQVLPGGLAILLAAFEALGLERMEAAEGALREGLVYDQLGRIGHEDVRGASVKALARRYHVDQEQAARVANTAQRLFEQVHTAWQLGETDRRVLVWAAELHEIGLDISHSHYHKHGGYILSYGDVAGFSRQEQQLLALLVRAHRRKFPSALFEELPESWRERGQRLAALLRLAVVLHRGRSASALPPWRLEADNNALTLVFPPGWLEQHPLAAADLEEESGFVKAAGLKLAYA